MSKFPSSLVSKPNGGLWVDLLYALIMPFCLWAFPYLLLTAGTGYILGSLSPTLPNPRHWFLSFPPACFFELLLCWWFWLHFLRRKIIYPRSPSCACIKLPFFLCSSFVAIHFLKWDKASGAIYFPKCAKEEGSEKAKDGGMGEKNESTFLSQRSKKQVDLLPSSDKILKLSQAL